MPVYFYISVYNHCDWFSLFCLTSGLKKKTQLNILSILDLHLKGVTSFAAVWLSRAYKMISLCESSKICIYCMISFISAVQQTALCD